MEKLELLEHMADSKITKSMYPEIFLIMRKAKDDLSLLLGSSASKLWCDEN
jgi:hypothetical protein